jgi:hypothetical protein
MDDERKAMTAETLDCNHLRSLLKKRMSRDSSLGSEKLKVRISRGSCADSAVGGIGILTSGVDCSGQCSLVSATVTPQALVYEYASN